MYQMCANMIISIFFSKFNLHKPDINVNVSNKVEKDCINSRITDADFAVNVQNVANMIMSTFTQSRYC